MNSNVTFTPLNFGYTGAAHTPTGQCQCGTRYKRRSDRKYPDLCKSCAVRQMLKERKEKAKSDS